MSFVCVHICEYGYSDDYSYVSVAPTGAVIEEKLDNGLNNHLIAKNVSLKRYNPDTDQWSCIVELADKSKVDVYVTEGRCIFVCDSYDKGSSWYGEPISAMVLTGISRAVAAARTKNKIFTGQVRYEWLSRIGYIRKKKWSDEESVYIYYSDDDKNLYRVCIWFNKGTDTSFIANEILHLACKYRLSMTDEKDQDEINFFNKFCMEKIKYNDSPDTISLVSFPTKYYAPFGKKYRPNMNPSMPSSASSAATGIDSNQDYKLEANIASSLTSDSNKNKAKLFCGMCGTEISTEASFCPECGNKIE